MRSQLTKFFSALRLLNWCEWFSLTSSPGARPARQSEALFMDGHQEENQTLSGPISKIGVSNGGFVVALTERAPV